MRRELGTGMGGDFFWPKTQASFGASVFVCFEKCFEGCLGENTNHRKHYLKHYKTLFTQNTCQNTCLKHWFYKLVYSTQMEKMDKKTIFLDKFKLDFYSLRP